MGNLVTTKIITGGLGVGMPACQGIITTHFSLYCTDTPTPIPPENGGGGPYPGEAWNKVDNIQNFFTPTEQDIYDPDKLYATKKQVVIRVDLGNIHMEKIYLVPIRRAESLVVVLNLLNTTKERISVGITKMRRVLHNIKVSVLNLKKKK